MKSHRYALPAALVLIFAGCKEDSSIKPNYPGPDHVVTKLLTNLNEPSQIFEAQSENPIDLVGNGGTRLSLPPNAFIHPDGSEVEGNIELEFREAYNKSQFILNRIPTVTNEGKILESSGAFYIKASQGGQELNLDKSLFILNIPITPAGYMELYYGSLQDTEFQWLNVQDIYPFAGVTMDPTGAFSFMLYISPIDTGRIQFPFPELGWLNCDDTISSTLPTTSIAISFEDKFNDQNTFVYIVFDDINSLMQVYEFENSTFISPSNIPITYAVTLVAISVDDNSHALLDTRSITVTQDHHEELNPVLVSEEEFLARLKELDE